MKRLAFWGAVCIFAVVVQIAVTHRLIAPHIDNYLYRITWTENLLARDMDTGTGWRALTPHYAWPILVTYGGALVALAITIALIAWYYKMQSERQAIARREAAVGLQEEQVRIVMAEAERIRKAAENREQEAREEVARCKQEAAAQIKEANDRLQGSVSTNIGRQRTIQKLRERVTELEEQVKIGSC